MKKFFTTIIMSMTIFTLSIATVGCKAASETPQTSQTTETRTVSTVKGDVTIPADPKRIADVSGISDMLYILGNKPVATSDSDAYDHTKFPVYLEKELEGAKIVGYPMTDTVDVEGVLASQPDLIIMNPRQEKAYDQFSKIAPTIMISPDVNNWRNDFKMVGKLFDKEAAAESYIQDYDTKTKEIGDTIKKANGENATYFAFLTAGSDYYLFTGAAYGDILYNDMKLAAPASLPQQDNISLPVSSLEGLTKIDADYMIVLASDEDKATLEASSVWKNMTAVKNSHVIWLPQSPYFNQAYSVYGKLSLVDKIKELLIQK